MNYNKSVWVDVFSEKDFRRYRKGRIVAKLINIGFGNVVNSWDIVRPIFLIEKSLNSLSEFSPIFIAVFSIATAMLYVLYYAFDKFVIKHD